MYAEKCAMYMYSNILYIKVGCIKAFAWIGKGMSSNTIRPDIYLTCRRRIKSLDLCFDKKKKRLFFWHNYCDSEGHPITYKIS